MSKPITARHDLTIWRNDDYYEYPIRVVGLDLTDTALAMEIRRGGDVSGAPEIALAKIKNGENGATFETQGLHVRSVTVVDGVEVSDVRIRIDRPNLQALPYDGERGDAATFEYALVIGGRTRIRGNVILPAHAYRSDAAPSTRESGYSSSYARQGSSPDSGASLTISQDGGATLQIDGAEMVSGAIVRAEAARDEAVAAADDTVAALDNLGQDAFNYVGRPADAVLVNGTPTGIGSVFWHDVVDVAGNLTAVDVFDRAAGVINVAVYRGAFNALVRVGLGSFATAGTGTSRRIALAAPLAVRAGDLLAIQGAAGALTVNEVQSGDVGYTYSGPYLPENVALGAPTTNGQVQVRFVITYREQIVTADNFLALSEIRVIGARARALSSAANPAGYVAWSTTGAPTGHTVTWGSYTAKLGPLADRMEFPQWSVSKPLFVIGNSLSDPTDVLNRWSQLLAARYGQHLVSVARYSSDQRMVYRSGAAPISLTLAGALPAGASVAVTQINGAPIDGNNPAAFLTTGDPAVVTGMSMSGYVSRNGVEHKVTVSAPNGASFAYSVTQAPGQTAIEFDGPVLFTPEASLAIHGSTCIVWPGNNYFYSQVPNQFGDYTNPQMWVDLKLIVSFLQSQGCQVLLLPVIPASLPEWVEGVGTPLTASRAANARTERLFPGLMARHADGRDLIKFLQDRNDGSADAKADVAKGWIPRNLHRAGDTLHLNADGDIAVADFVDSALRSQVGPPAITQATTFTIRAEGPQAGPDATASVRVVRDQLASLADAVDGVVQDAVFRPTIAAAIEDFDVGTFFVSRDLDGLTAHTGVKWQYKVTADAPYFSDEGAWSDTDAAALGLDAFVGTTPARLPVSIEQATAITNARADALAGTSALGLMTANALDQRLRFDVPQVRSDGEKATARTTIGAIDQTAVPVYPTRAAVQALAIPMTVTTFQVSGYGTPGDGGDATFIRLAPQPDAGQQGPVQPSRLQDASGAWFEQQGPEWRPQHFGGFPGSVNATAAFVAADACAKASGGWVSLIRGGIWSIADFVQTCRWIFGEGRLLTRVRRAVETTVAVWSLATGAAGMTVQDLTIDGASGTEACSLLALGDFRSDVLIQRVGLENGMGRWALRADPLKPFYNLQILDCHVENCPSGGFAVLAKAKGNQRLRINRNTLNRVGTNLCIVRGPGDVDRDMWNTTFDVEGNDNTVTNCLNTGEYGPIPFEFWGCTNGQILRNQVDTGTRGIGLGSGMQNFEVAFNLISNQTFYAFEGGLSRNLRIHHNTALNCRVFTPFPGTETENLFLEDNTLIGTALLAYTPAKPADSVFVSGVATGLRIRRMVIRNPEYARWAINLSGLSKPVPTISIAGGGTGATATATLKGVRVRLKSGNAGSGYTNPTVTVEGGGGSGMVITPTFADGALTGGVVTNSGTGFTSMPKLNVSDPTGVGGELEIFMGIETVTGSAGTGYANSTWTASDNGATTAAAGTFTVTNGVPGAFAVTDPGEGFGRASDFIIDAPEIYQDTYSSSPAGISTTGNGQILNPIIKRSASYDAAHYYHQALGGATQIAHSVNATAGGNPSFVLHNPVCEMTGTVSGGATYAAIGRLIAAQPMYGFELRGGGKVSGNFTANPINLPDTSGTAKVGLVDTTGFVGNAYNLGTSIIRRRTKNVIEGSAAPTTGTHGTGDRCVNNLPTSGSAFEWQCTAGGSPGIWVGRFAAGSDPVIPTAYASMSTLTNGQLLTAAANIFSTIKIRCDVVTAGASQPHASYKIEWGSRLNNNPRRGEVLLAFGSANAPAQAPLIKSVSIDDVAANAATVATSVDSSGRMEVTITFPTTLGAAIAVRLSGLASNVGSHSNYSVQVT